MRKFTKQQLKDLDDHDIPTVNSEVSISIERWELIHGRGFWGNATTGYIYDKDYNKD